MAVRIDYATVDDEPAIVQLVTINALPLDGLPDCLGTAIVARLDGRVVGCAALELYPDGALLRSVAVDADVRSRGIGRQLTEAALDLAERRAVPAVYLLTTTAEAFFRRLGFNRLERGDVPATVRESVEFRSACPASAIAMGREFSA